MKKYRLPSPIIKSETVILANGQFPSHELPLSILENCEYLVCCDGAINNLSQINREPDIIIGDCDSLSEENKEKYRNVIHRIADQETNDLTKAVNFCVELGRKNITILGATGKREDHSIANISLLSRYMDIADVEIISDYGVFNPIEDVGIFESFPKQQVSLFCIKPAPISCKGLLYPFTDAIFDSWWQATLNESLGHKFEIKAGGKTVVYRLFDTLSR